MIKVSVFFPNNEGCKFDMDYYCNSHMPMVQEKLGKAVKGVAVEQGLGGAEPGSLATYVARGIFYAPDYVINVGGANGYSRFGNPGLDTGASREGSARERLACPAAGP